MSSKKRSFVVTGRGGVKKQKLTALSKQLITATKTARATNQYHADKANKLAAKKAGKRENRAKIMYNRHQQFLTVGEGNFSFTHALIEHFMKQAKEGTAAPQATPTPEEAAAAKAEEEEEKREAAATTPTSKAAKIRFKRAHQFDPAAHTPFLPPNSIFTNPDCRVVATCYDSFKELTFKYPDVTKHLDYLNSRSIPLYSGVDATHFELARRRPITSAMIQAARQEEASSSDERERARQKRKELEESQEDYIHAQDEEEAASSSSSSSSTASPLLFPPFFTRRALLTIQSDAENKLHGSQRKKWKVKHQKEQEEFKAAVLDVMDESKPTGQPKHTKPPSSAVLKMKQRQAQTDAQLSQLNQAPRTRFHKIIFNFPHTGCGIKDTEQNNEQHRKFLEGFFRNIVQNRLVYPADQFGEIHVTLKKGEPYKSWNIINISKKVTGLKFKTSVEFYPHLYKGYEHRRTRGFEERTIDLATGAIIDANADISGSGSMTYVFTRERTAMDDEEERFDRDWIEKYGIQFEQDEIKRKLLEECDRIYKETKAKHGESVDNNDQTIQMDETVDDDDQSGDEEADEDEDQDAEEADDEEVDDEEEDPVDDDQAEDDEDEQTPVDAAAADEDMIVDDDATKSSSDADDSPAVPKLAPNFAAAFRQHFQRPAQTNAAATQPPRTTLFSAKKTGGKQNQKASSKQKFKG